MGDDEPINDPQAVSGEASPTVDTKILESAVVGAVAAASDDDAAGPTETAPQRFSNYCKRIGGK